MDKLLELSVEEIEEENQEQENTFEYNTDGEIKPDSDLYEVMNGDKAEKANEEKNEENEEAKEEETAEAEEKETKDKTERLAQIQDDWADKEEKSAEEDAEDSEEKAESLGWIRVLQPLAEAEEEEEVMKGQDKESGMEAMLEEEMNPTTQETDLHHVMLETKVKVSLKTKVNVKVKARTLMKHPIPKRLPRKHPPTAVLRKHNCARREKRRRKRTSIG